MTNSYLINNLLRMLWFVLNTLEHINEEKSLGKILNKIFALKNICHTFLG